MLLTQRAVAAALHMPVCVETRELMLDDASLVRMEEAIFKPISSLVSAGWRPSSSLIYLALKTLFA
eukprot:1159825-Pelagomonas_calceolata.AAC.2